jgi:hypothetical protein
MIWFLCYSILLFYIFGMLEQTLFMESRIAINFVSISEVMVSMPVFPEPMLIEIFICNTASRVKSIMFSSGVFPEFLEHEILPPSASAVKSARNLSSEAERRLWADLSVTSTYRRLAAKSSSG